MTEVAHVADIIDHHPNWSNVYNKLEVSIWNHKRDGVTLRDIFLALAMVY